MKNKETVTNQDTFGHRITMSRDRTGRMQPQRNITTRERERRRDHAERLWREGATRAQIARALDVGLDTVGKDLRARGLGHGKRYRTQIPELLPVDWLDPEVEPEPPAPAYLHSVTLGIWKTFVRESRNQHHANRLAHDAADADEASDQVWLAEAAEVMSSAIAEANRLYRIVTDKNARLVGQREELSTEPRPNLRVLR